jgi:hypothetical protein
VSTSKLTPPHLAEKNTSLSNCQPIQLPTYSGVYFLRQGPTIVYVGQSRNIAGRVATHWADNHKEFDSIEAMQVPEEQLDLVEQYWIQNLQPRYNRFVDLPKSEFRQRRGRVDKRDRLDPRRVHINGRVQSLRKSNAVITGRLV